MFEQLLVVALFVLLLAITAGVIYITWSDFRDRRRRDAARPPAAPPSRSTKRRGRR